MTATNPPPTFAERLLRGMSYFCVGLLGIWVLTQILIPVHDHSPSLYVFSVLIKYLAIAWVLFLLVAFPAAVAAWLGKYQVELLCIPWFTGALLVADVASWVRVFEPGGNSAMIGSLLVTLALCVKLISRYVYLAKLVNLVTAAPPSPPLPSGDEEGD